MKYLKLFKIFENQLMDDLLDKINIVGYEDLTSLEKKILDAISKGDDEFIENIKKRNYDYYKILKEDPRNIIPEEAAKQMTKEDVIEVQLMTLWDFMHKDDISSFIEEFDYISDVEKMPWDKLPRNIQKDFYKFSKRYI